MRKGLLDGWYPLGLIVHQQRYPPSDNKTDYWMDGILWD
jgi:hypothetical protein